MTVLQISWTESVPLQHEHENLRRMIELIVREKSILDAESLKTLCSTFEEKLDGHTQSGLTMTPDLKLDLLIDKPS